jgi:cation:H+ antiporter
MFVPALTIVVGLVLLVWSADRFIEGAASLARHFGMSPLLIGMLIVGFGTSAPEMFVSALASSQGSPGIALGNAYGSNIANIALILGLTAMISPIAVHSRVLRQELPILTLVSGLAVFQVLDEVLSRTDGVVLLMVFAGLMAWSIHQGIRERSDTLGTEMENKMAAHSMPLGRGVAWLLIGLVLLIVSSRMLVWGAVDIARQLGVDDLIIGLTVVAIGTSLPELAASIIAIRRNEHEIALGNVIGSNLFNTLAVVGIAGAIHPTDVAPELLSRDMALMVGLTLFLFLAGYSFRGVGRGRINRFEGGGLVAVYLGYTTYLILGVLGGRA